ncbi:MAG: hypothetical protein AAFX09_07215 [Pseudomonadota bacterium]
MIGVVIAALALQLAPASFSEAQTVIEACQSERLGIVSTEYGDVLCVRQSLASRDVERVARLVERLQRAPVNGLVLRSAGGRVDLWLDLIEASQPPRSFVVVDDICLSSCANYGFAAGAVRIVPDGSLVGWHGGPTGDAAFMEQFIRDVAGVSADDAPELVALGARTEALYDRLGLSTQVLQHSHRPSPPFNLTRLRRRLGGGAITGVAFEPAVLASCFGFDGLDLMTHPGDDAATLRASWAKSRRWGLFTRPGDLVTACRPQRAR